MSHNSDLWPIKKLSTQQKVVGKGEKEGERGAVGWREKVNQKQKM